jgi:hypothetical protein
MIAEKSALAIGPPITVLFLGWALLWAVSGFAKTQ